jgi:hypothetical protein
MRGMRWLVAAALVSFGFATFTPREAHADPGGDGRGQMLLIGLGLVGAGLVAGGAGIAVLVACDNPMSSCHGDAATIGGWVLAAPGILPLLVGGVMVYVAMPDSNRRVMLPSPRMRGLAGLSATPLPGGGGAVGASFVF